eukprot:superscaffoldBa00003085_g16073
MQARAHPLLLVGSDHANLITAPEPVRLGPAGGPATVHTQLGWALQGPDGLPQYQVRAQQCLWAAVGPTTSDDIYQHVEYIYQHVECLWRLDMLPYRSDKLVTRSWQDQEAVGTLEAKTERVTILPPPDPRCIILKGFKGSTDAEPQKYWKVAVSRQVTFTTQVKVIVQKLWSKQRNWDDPNLPVDFLQAWTASEQEVSNLSSITFPRCYVPLEMDTKEAVYECHIFCDASEVAYGSVAYVVVKHKTSSIPPLSWHDPEWPPGINCQFHA